MNESIAEKKKKLRSSFLKVRKSLTESEVNDLSKEIIARLAEQSFFISADTVHVYVSMDKNREVATKDFILRCFERGKKVVIPKMGKQGNLFHHQIESLDELTLNKWGVLEPRDKRRIKPAELSLIVVPMVAADFGKNRLGYGKGYYDRFLTQTNAFRAGLCFNCTLSWSVLPTNEFDQPMDKIITESKVL